ncbi:MAG: tetraacyldisaccharide 4'-kinase [Gammaproteobacteria bacterium]|nr:tetraacyldisaccharide 4'-kinase [Gammaproteobacteria bacterium]MDH3506812.1 tetraacyldisaccharide 4'-kinase [Gammaproteobacteria bacterium]
MWESLGRRLESIWYSPQHPMRWVLWPLEMLYRLVSILRRDCYTLGIKKIEHLPVPVIVVGNLTVGGTGKTPCVIWLANQLKDRGLRVGCVSRGYGGNAADGPRRVKGDSDPLEVGDEPVLIAAATSCPVMVAADRVAAAKALLAETRLDALIADDGLQHLALGRTFEIAVVDGERGLGNEACLPAGPLREPATRLNHVDAVIVNGGDWGEGSVFRMTLVPDRVYQLAGKGQRTLSDFRDTIVHAVAGIGNPDQYFEMLRSEKIRVIRHAFPDHARYQPSDLDFGDQHPVLMTEKDAVKCRAFADPRFWSVAVNLEFQGGDGDRLLRRVLRDL